MACIQGFSFTGKVDNSTETVTCGPEALWNTSYNCQVEGLNKLLNNMHSLSRIYVVGASIERVATALSP